MKVAKVLTRRPVHRPAAQQMHMQMKDGLPRAGAGVDDRAIPAFAQSVIVCHARFGSPSANASAVILPWSLLRSTSVLAGTAAE